MVLVSFVVIDEFADEALDRARGEGPAKGSRVGLTRKQNIMKVQQYSNKWCVKNLVKIILVCILTPRIEISKETATLVHLRAASASI